MPRAHVYPDGKRLSALRGEANLTQRELARLAGFGLRTISKLEAGWPTTCSTLAIVAEALAEQLGREVPLSALLHPAPAVSCEPLLSEHVRILDLRGPRPTGVLTDHYRIRSVPGGLQAIECHYGTSGTQLTGESLSHPRDAYWTENPALAPGWLSGTLRVNLDPGVMGQPCEVRNRIAYGDGFDESRPWFQAQVLYPTGSLSLVLCFPQGKTPAVRGLRRVRPESPFDLTPGQPMVASEPGLVCWGIANPNQGETYHLDWMW